MPNSPSAISIVIPAYNEENGIGPVLSSVEQVMQKSGLNYEIIVVDDGSKDRTVEAAMASGATVIRHHRNRGYGASLKTGLLAAKHELIGIIDADGTYPADMIPELVRRMKTNDMVVGARTTKDSAIPLVRKPAKWVLNKFANYVTQHDIPDLNSGLRVFKAAVARRYLGILPDKFSFTTTITVAHLCDNYDVEYVPIQYFTREGKSKIKPVDFFRFMFIVTRLGMLFVPGRIFVPVSLSLFFLCMLRLCMDLVLAFTGYAAEVPFWHRPIVSTSAQMLFVSALQFLLFGGLAEILVARSRSPKAGEVGPAD